MTLILRNRFHNIICLSTKIRGIQPARKIHGISGKSKMTTGVFEQVSNSSVGKKVFLSTMPALKTTVNNIVKSEEDKRLYRGLELENGMKVLLISDPTTDKSAAAMDVHVGSMSDPRELPGLAHFCEHMLFLGTSKYPDENEYNKFLSVNGGSSNAFTASDHTNYYFDISPDKLEGALDRFSEFFRTPLFTESATEREVKAVNSEHEKNIPMDAWRINQIEKATANSEHDFSKFGTGNIDTLDRIPKEKNMVVRDELLKFHSHYYSSNIMGLAVLGQQDLDTLENLILGLMSDVENKNVEVPSWAETPFTEKELQTITYIVPVKDIRSLSITWGIPDLRDDYKSSPGSYLGHLIGHEGPGSLLSELKSRGWVNNLVGGQKSGAKGFGFFVVNVDLTEDGIQHIDDIITLIFQYLELLRMHGPQEWIFQECRDLNAMQFRFKDKERPQSYVCGLAGHLHDYPTEEVLSGGYLLTEWKPELITEVLNHLTPDTVRVAVTAQRYADRCDTVEQWYGSKYKTEKLDSQKLDSWRNCGMHDNLKLPDKNEFIPSHFQLVEREQDNPSHPTIIEEDVLGRLWFKQDDEFLLPKTCINIEMRSPVAYSDPLSANLTYMFSLLFKDELNEYVYAAELAGLGYSLANTKAGITLAIKGYSDKQKVLLEKIMDKLTSFQVNEKRFDILKEAYVRGLKNFAADQPHQHAVYFNSVVLAEKFWHKEELISCLDSLTVDELRAFIPRLLANIKLECLVYGNSTADEAKELYNYTSKRLREECNARPLLPSQCITDREIQLTDLHAVYKTTNAVHKASCIEVYYQCGVQDTRANMQLELLAQIIRESCFDQLRTKEQLGYIVFSGLRRSNGAQGLRVIVQSEKVPEYVDTRIEEYIAGLNQTLQEMTAEEFSSHVEALATKRLEKPKKMSVKNGKYWSEILSKHLNFNRDIVEVEMLRSLTKDDILQFYIRYVSHLSEHRRKLSCHVVSTTPSITDTAADTTVSVTAKDVPESDSCVGETAGARVVVDITEFKMSQPLFPLPRPFTPVHFFKSTKQNSK